MMVAGSRIRQIGWAVVLAVCFGLLLALTFKVNAVKSEVRLTERRIIAMQQDRLMLETEFQTRASQQQLANWNAIEFGYGPPRANQYLENERQLAALGTPRGMDAPAPVRVALNRPVPEEEGLFTEWLGDEESPSVRKERNTPREFASTDLAQRLTQPVGAVAGVAEVGQ